MDRFESDINDKIDILKANLHSNMDRFERTCYHAILSPTIRIYIPIWIDLKAPVLRGSFSPVLNLDRFERSDHSKVTRSFHSYLHSNMDRFESIMKQITTVIYFHLHSNMDRFESRAIS